MRWLLLILFAWSSFGQDVVPNRRRNFQPASGPVTPASIASIRYWWRFEDNPTNVNVTNWVDRIAGLSLTNGDNTLRPTNSSTGVGFNGSTSLTNVNPFSLTCGAPGCQTFSGANATNGTLWVIMSPQSTGFTVVIGDDNGGGKGLLTQSTKVLKWFAGVATVTIFTYQTGVPVDVGICITNGANNSTFYTNGVLAAQQSNVGLDASPERWVGAYSGGGNFNGKIIDIAYYTNYLTASQMTTLHTYALTRGVSP